MTKPSQWVCKPAYLVPVPSQDKLEGCVRKGIRHKNGGDGVAVHPHCWCIRLCYLHFAPENPEDSEMYLLVLAHLGCPGQSPESHKTVVVVVVLDCNKLLHHFSSVKGRRQNVLKQLFHRSSRPMIVFELCRIFTGCS